MSRAVRLSDEAQRHFDDAADWYRRQAPHQVARFVADGRATGRRIGDFPFLGRSAYGGLRVVAMRAFPFNFWYSVEGDEVVVVAVTHMRRDAGAVLRRLRGQG